MQSLSSLFTKIDGNNFIDYVPLNFVAKFIFAISANALEKRIRQGQYPFTIIKKCKENNEDCVILAELEHFINSKRLTTNLGV